MGDAEAEHLLLAGKTLDKVRRVLYSAAEPELPPSPKIKVKQPSPRHELLAPASAPLTTIPSSKAPSSNNGARRSPALGQIQHISTSTASAEGHRSTPMFTNLLEAAAFISPDQRAAMLAQMTQQQKRKAPDPPRQTPIASAALVQSIPQPEANKKRKLANVAANDYSALDVLADQATSQFPNAQVGMQYQDPRAAMDEDDEGSSGQQKGSYQKWTPAEVSCPVLFSRRMKLIAQQDELLVKSILTHSMRWESVASAIPSRAIHQCRQRWQKGLKNGTNLAPELARYLPQIQELNKKREMNGTALPYRPREGTAVGMS